MLVDWGAFKAFVDARSLSVQWIELQNKYWLKAFDGPFHLETAIFKKGTADDPSDQKDFEDNYKTAGNTTYTDGDNASLQRTKMATAGWTYQARFMEFTTSLLTSIKNDDVDATDHGDATIKFYDDQDVELTVQGDLDTDCVKTVFCFEPIYHMELIGGSIKASPTPTNDVYMWCIAVPDLTQAQGGSKNMINQLNLKIKPEMSIDGRTPKRMNYDAVYHTNKLCKTFKHNAGDQCKIMVEIEHFKL
jgi:hypothetical protein